MSSDRPTKRIQPIRKNERLTGKRLSEPIDAVNRIAGGINPITQILKSGKSKAISIGRFRIMDASPSDYLVCRETDGTAIGTRDIYVARPTLLRNMSSRDGVDFSYSNSQTRTANNGADTESQVIVASYLAGDEIFAMRGILRGSGVYSDPGRIRKVEWIDLNLDGRYWAQTEE